MEEPQQHSRNSKHGEDNGERRVSSARRRTGPGNRPRRPLFLRCLLIRNLPKGFVGWSDLTDKNTPIRVRRIVYCEESNGSIMVEFMSEAERNTVLALDQQRKRRIRQRIQEQAPLEGTSEINTNSNNKSKSYAFEIKVTVERCASERFVRTVLSGGSNNNASRRNGNMEPQNSEAPPLLTGTFTDPTSPLAGPPASPLPPSRLVRRCIVIRKCSNPDNVEEGLEIPEAPPYERKFRADDGSIRSADSLGQKQQRPPSPMEIRSGNLSEVVVRGVTLRNKSNMMPAMVVELESEESVDRILMAEEAKQRMENAQPTTLAIPVELHAVKSERYARLCFGNTRINPKQNEKKPRNDVGSGIHTFVSENEKGGVDEESRVTMTDETTNDTENGDSLTIEEVVEESIDTIGGVQKLDVGEALNNSENQQNPMSSCPDQIESGPLDEPNRHQEWMEECRKNEILEAQVRELLAENDRLKSAESAQLPLGEKDDIPDCSQKSENDSVKVRVDEMEKLESELEESRTRLKQTEEARNKLEDENSGLLRYVLELEGHRSGKAMADEERHKELEKKHSDLSTLYRFVQAQAEKSAKDLRKAIQEKEAILSELEGFKVAWRARMETQRHLEKSKNKDGRWLCIDCETVKFYAMIEECKNSGGNSEVGEESAHSDYGSESAPIPNGVLPGHEQTNGKAPGLVMT